MAKLGIPLFVLLYSSALVASGQQDPPLSRAEVIERERDTRAGAAHPDYPSNSEQFLRKLQDRKTLEKITAGYAGFNARFGNLVTGAGFAVGPQWRRMDMMGGRLDGRFAVQGATSRSWKAETQWTVPSLAGDWLYLDLGAATRNYNRINYYGLGSRSSRTGRTNYRMEDTFWDTSLALRKLPKTLLGATLGYSWINIGPGTDVRLASTDATYSPRQAPGIDEQSTFLRNGAFVQFDYRDNPAGPKSGGNYVLQYTWFRDRQLGRYSFRRMDVDLQQYLALYNKTRRFAFRFRATLTGNDAGNTVPFYLMPRLGGSDDLRGYRPFRFTDRNMAVLNGEYRWEVFSGLDGAIFADTGKVFARHGMFNAGDLETSYGFGLRFNAKNRTFIRLDVGFSNEGYMIWFKFNDPFLPRRLGTTTGQPAY